MRKFFYLLLMCGVGLTAAALAQGGSDAKKALTEAVGLMQAGNFTEAEKVLQKARKAAPNNGDVYNLLGIVYDQRGDFKAAETAYLTAVKLNPKAVSPLANFGVLLVKLKREKEAVGIFESVLKINPTHPQTIINLGFLYHSAGDFPRAAEFLGKANLLQPKSPDILFKLAAALYQTQKFAEAKQIFGQLSPSAQTNYYLGLIAFEENNQESARDYFEKSLSLKPDFAAANFMLGEILAKEKRYREAIPFYEKAVAQDKTKDVYFVRLGGTFLYNYDFEKAFQYFNEAADLFPQIAEIKYFMAITARGLGNYDLAFKEAKKALSLKETADTNALIGSMLIDRNEYQEAEKYLRKAVTLNPDHFNSHHDLGRFLIKQQKFDEALPILQKASLLMPDNADVHYQLFLAFSRLKRKAEADRELALFKQLSEKK
jgi:tetratricopeptide (TPR) repeat protein